MATEQAATAAVTVVAPAAPAAVDTPVTQVEIGSQPSADAATADTSTSDLAAAVAEHAAKLDGMKERTDAATPAADQSAKPDAEQPAAEGDAKEGSAKTGEAKDPKAPEKKPEDDKPKDEAAATIAKYIRQNEKAIAREKEAKDKLAQLDKDRSDIAAERQETTRIKAIVSNLADLAARRPAEAIEQLLGTQALVDENSTLITDLIEYVNERRSGQPAVSPEDRISAEVKRQVEAERKAAEDAAAKAKTDGEAARKTKREQAFASYLTGLAEEFNLNADKYPFLQDEPITKAEYPQIDRFNQEYFDKNRKLPTGDEILSHFNGMREQRALAGVAFLRKTGKIPGENPARPATQQRTTSPMVAPATVDSRGMPTVRTGERTLAEERDEIARQLDAKLSAQLRR